MPPIMSSPTSSRNCSGRRSAAACSPPTASCGATSAGSSPPISRRPRSTPWCRSSRARPGPADWRAGAARHGRGGDRDDDADHRRQPVRRRSAADHRGGDGAYHRRARGRRRGAAAGAARPAADAVEPARQAGAARPGLFARARSTEVVAERLPGRRARRFPRPADPRAGRQVRARGGAGARGRQCRDLLSRRPRDHRQCDHLDARSSSPSSPICRPRRPPKPRRALAAGEEDADLPERLPLLRRILEESMRLYPPVPRFDRQAVAADRLGDA